MKLREVLNNFDRLDNDEVIFSRRPWSLEEDAIIDRLDSDYRVPENISSSGFDYFIDVATAREALEVFGNTSPSLGEKCDLLMYYAEHDAFPDWVYQRKNN